VAPGELAELREARLAAFGAVQVRVDHRTGDDGQGLHLQGAELTGPLEPGTDIALLAAGHPTLTRLESIAARPGILAAARA
jgi:5'-nucleotidase